MAAEQTVEGLRSLLREAVGDAGIADHGHAAIEGVMRDARIALAHISEQSSRDAEALAAGADTRVLQAAADRRAALCELREDLLDQATCLAMLFEGLLDDIDHAESRLPRVPAVTAPRPTPEDAARVEAIRFTVADRPRITFGMEPATETATYASEEGALGEEPGFAAASGWRRWLPRRGGRAA